MDEYVTVTTGTGLIVLAVFLGLGLFAAAFLNGLALPVGRRAPASLSS